MDALEIFSQLTRTFAQVVMQGSDLDLQGRVLTVHASLSSVLAGAPRLPVAPGETRETLGPFPTDWPGFGSFERYWSVGPLAAPSDPRPASASQSLAFVFGQLWDGLEAHDNGDAARAAGVWSRGFEDTWGPVATELVHHLHPAVVGYRRDGRRPARRKRDVAEALVMVRPETQEDESVGMGVQFERVAGGLLVLSVHERGTASRILESGDLLLAVDGEPLDVPDEALGALLRGSTGEQKRFEVFRNGETLTVSVPCP